MARYLASNKQAQQQSKSVSSVLSSIACHVSNTHFAAFSPSFSESLEPKFTLIAEMEPAGSYQTGVLVRRGGRAPLVVQSMGISVFSLLSADGSRTENACICHYSLVGGSVEFTIECMNVQGGGVATSKQLGLGDTLLSFEWLESAKPKRYVDTTGIPAFEPALKDTIQRHRSYSFLQFMIQFKEQRQDDDVYTVGKTFYLDFLQGVLVEPFKLMESLHYVPMILFPHIMAALLRDMGRAKRNIVQSMARALFDVFYDKDWTCQCKELILLCRVDDDLKAKLFPSEKQVIEKTMWMSMWNALFLLSQWYSGVDDNETALRYLHDAVEWVQGTDCLKEQDAKYYLSIAAHNLARGYVDVGHIAAAFDNLERAFDLCPNMKKAHIREARRLRKHARNWIGTSGTLTPFETQRPPGYCRLDDDEAFDLCRNCGESDPIHACAACGMTNYCGSQCQAVHWKAVHQHTCLFLPEKGTDGPNEKRRANKKRRKKNRRKRGKLAKDV